MKTTVKINALTQEITMTKAAAKRASFFGTTEYENLVQAKKDFPDFTVRIVSPKTKKPRESENKGLTIKFMKELVKVITGDNKAAIEEFNMKIAAASGTKGHYSKPRAYFLSEYPNWRNWLLKVEEQKAGEVAEEPQAEPTQVEPVTAVDQFKSRLEF